MKRFVISIIGLVVFCSSATAQLTDKQQIAKLNSVYEHIRDNYVDDVSLEPLVQEAIIATFKELDPHSKYLTKEEMESAKARLRGKFAGIGINYIMHNDTLVVRNTMDDSPARSSAILPNDRITAINSQSIIGLTTDSITTLHRTYGSRQDRICQGTCRERRQGRPFGYQRGGGTKVRR